MTANTHASKIDRILRRLAALDEKFERYHQENARQGTATAMDLGALTVNLNQLRETMRVVIGHSERLVREKETLRIENLTLRARLKVREADEFMAVPTLRAWK